MSRSSLFPRLFKQINNQARLPLTTSTRPTPFLNTTWSSSIPRVPVMRQVHSSPKEYNGLQSAAYHFKRQRHMPYFLEYLMWVVFGSEALHLIWLKIDYKEYKEKTQHKTKLLEEIIRRLENGEEMTDSLREEIRMVLMKHKNSEDQEDIDDEYLNHCKFSALIRIYT